MNMQVPPGYALPFIKNGSGGIQLPFTHAAPLPRDSGTPLGAAPEGEVAPSTQPAAGAAARAPPFSAKISAKRRSMYLFAEH